MNYPIIVKPLFAIKAASKRRSERFFLYLGLRVRQLHGSYRAGSQMKHLIERLLDKLAQRVVQRISFLRFGDSFDVQEMAFARAAMESVDFYEAELRNASPFADSMALLAHAVSIAPEDGLLMEFGVSAGGPFPTSRA